MHKLGKSFEDFIINECKDEEIYFAPSDIGTLNVHTVLTKITDAFEKWLAMAADEGLIRRVTAKDVKPGLKVLDERGQFGEITTFEDLHNVYVEFNEKGDESVAGGYYCYVEGCGENSENEYPLYIPNKI